MPETIYYDGHCGLCHGFVKFVLARDPAAQFHFSPLDNLPAVERAGLPDSVVIRTARNGLLTRSSAALYILSKLGGPWVLISRLARLFPRALRDLVYDGIARFRYQIFGRRDAVCPLIPKELRSRFET